MEEQDGLLDDLGARVSKIKEISREISDEISNSTYIIESLDRSFDKVP